MSTYEIGCNELKNVNYSGEDTPGAREDNTADIPRQPAYTPIGKYGDSTGDSARIAKTNEIPGDVQVHRLAGGELVSERQ